MKRMLLLTLAMALPALAAPAQPGDMREQRMMATELMLDSDDDEALLAYAAEHLAEGYRASFDGEAALLDHLRALREAAGPVGGVGLMVTGEDRYELHIHNHRGRSVVAVETDPAPPHRIRSLALGAVEREDPVPPLRWDELETTLEEAEAEGFCGSVLAVRDGEVVLDRGFGHADPQRRHPVTPQTLFAIGSTPIDFTHGAILELVDQGKLSLDDTLADHFPGVPADKAAITLEQLRTGRSGFIDFPGLEGVDENLDLSWIDRDEFLRRAFASELLFVPGSQRRHSHLAWGLLAAVVEVASGQGYEEFLREHFFGPAGMERTGHYPLAKQFPASEVAVGLGGNLWGEVNSPAHWGESSWLVLGSGGMVSTPRDLLRWRQFLRSDQGLSEESQAIYGVEGVFMAEGGNDRGFLNTIGAAGNDIIILCSNSHTRMGDEVSRLGERLSRLATGEGPR